MFKFKVALFTRKYNYVAALKGLTRLPSSILHATVKIINQMYSLFHLAFLCLRGKQNKNLNTSQRFKPSLFLLLCE